MAAHARAGDGDRPARAADPQKMVTVTYTVADLATPPGCPVPPAAAGARVKGSWETVRDAAAQGGKPAAPAKTTEEALMKQITSTVSPASWADAGGRGTIDYFPLTMALVVNQTPAVQEQVGDLLTALRRQRDVQVAVEVRLLSVPEEVLAGLRERPGHSSPKGIDEAHVRQLLEAVQRDARSNLMQAPRATVFSGQTAAINVTREETVVTAVDLTWENGAPVYVPKTEKVPVGLRLALRPVVSADRRSVRVDFGGQLCDVEPAPATGRGARVNRMKWETVVSLPDGRTALLDGGQRVRETTPDPVPVVNDLPWLGPWLREAGVRREVEHVLVMVTPRIVVQAEEEVKATGAAAAEEAEECPCADGHCPAAPESGCKKADVAELLRRYEAACAAGHTEEATTLAVRALALDPACFRTAAKAKSGR
jgi:type II secretory pathway component GspD/PulD (secretin)